MITQYVDLSNGLTAWHTTEGGVFYAVKLDEPGDKIGPRTIHWGNDFEEAVEITRENESMKAVLVVLNPKDPNLQQVS